VALVSIAFAMCVSLGIYQHERGKKIKRKKHSYKANSFFLHGLNTLRKMLKRDEESWQHFIAKFIRWFKLKISFYQPNILVR